MIRLLVKGVFHVLFIPTRAYFRSAERHEDEAEWLEIESQVDHHILALENMGFSRRDAARIVALKQNEYWHDSLTPEEKRELSEIHKRQFNTLRRAAE